MLKLVIFATLIAFVYGGSSPNGAQVLSSLPREQLLALPKDVIEDALLDCMGLLQKYGYPAEEHQVETEDGYLLTMHRITGGKSETAKANKPAVLLQHGLLVSSVDFIINGPEKSIGYLLADAGFDVWMGNARGNTYSRNHTSLDPDKSPFWKFSWHEIGYYDVPAMIDYILKATGQEQLHYIGHSQGTTVFFVMGATRTEYNSKIKSMHALSPVAYMGNLRSPIVRFLAPYANSLQTILSLIGTNEILPSNELTAMLGSKYCSDESPVLPICTNFLFLLVGYNPDQLNTTMLPLYMSHAPAGASSRQLVHYAQEHLSEKFRQYDHGAANIIHYGKPYPPDYDNTLNTAPIYLHYSDNDWMADTGDVEQLHGELVNPLGLLKVSMDTWNHLDFLWGINAKEYVYDKVIELMWDIEQRI